MTARIALVVAVARNGVIGRGGELPWHISSDLKRFKAVTTGKPVIMGRKTWESLPRKPLPGRTNIVVTRHQDYRAEGASTAPDITRAIAAASLTGPEEICVIGGGEVFREFLPWAGRMYLTEVDLAPAGDVLFPPYDPAEWQEISHEHIEKGPRDDASFTLRVLDRVKSADQS